MKHSLINILMIMFCVILLAACSLFEKTDQSSLPEDEMTEKTFVLRDYTKDGTTYEISEKDSALLSELFDVEQMKRTREPSQNPCSYQFSRGEDTYSFSEDLDYLDAVIAEESHSYYGKYLTETEVALLRDLIDSYLKN